MGKWTRISVKRPSLLATASEEDIAGNFEQDVVENLEPTLITRKVDNILVVWRKATIPHEQEKFNLNSNEKWATSPITNLQSNNSYTRKQLLQHEPKSHHQIEKLKPSVPNENTSLTRSVFLFFFFPSQICYLTFNCSSHLAGSHSSLIHCCSFY